MQKQAFRGTQSTTMKDQWYYDEFCLLIFSVNLTGCRVPIPSHQLCRTGPATAFGFATSYWWWLEPGLGGVIASLPI